MNKWVRIILLISTGMQGGHLNINLRKNCFRCNKCDFSGGVFALYSHYKGIPVNEVKGELDRIFKAGGINKPDNAPTAKAVIKPSIAETRLADIDTRDRVYRAYLSRLTLEQDHHSSLFLRGLSKDSASKLCYKTTPLNKHYAIAKGLMEQGFNLEGVPGFIRAKNGSWRVSSNNRGILIPAVDISGKIQGLHIRLDNTDDGKFRWFTSCSKSYLCPSKGWVHIAGAPTDTAILTEGHMKADIINHFDGRMVISVPGVNALSELHITLEKAKAAGLKRILIAFDMDYLTNKHVEDAYEKLLGMLSELKLPYKRLLWGAVHEGDALNGLDDYIFKHLRRSEYLSRVQAVQSHAHSDSCAHNESICTF